MDLASLFLIRTEDEAVKDASHKSDPKSNTQGKIVASERLGIFCLLVLKEFGLRQQLNSVRCATISPGYKVVDGVEAQYQANGRLQDHA